MGSDLGQPRSAIERRYGADAAADWQLLLTHFEFASDFSLVVLIVPDKDGADLCAGQLELHLGDKHKRLERLEPKTPEELRRLAEPLLRLKPEESIGAVWVSAVVPHSAPDYPEWTKAWRYALATLNQQRNPLRRQFDCPLVIVGAPWLVPVFRDIAPDLWSVRGPVIWIAPSISLESREESSLSPAPERHPSTDRETRARPSLDLALAEIARLRGVAGREEDLALALERAGRSQSAKGEFTAAESALREAADIRLSRNQPLDAARVLHRLAIAVHDHGRPAEAEESFRRALALAEEGGDTPVSRGITLDNLARAVRDQGRAAEAEELFRRALALKDKGGATPVSRGITLHELGRAVRDQGRAAEAEQLLRRALALKDEGGATPVSLSITLDELARAVRDQGRAPEAEELFRRALALAKEGGDTPGSRAIVLHELARAVRDQGRAAEAEDLFRQAREMREAGGGLPATRS